MVIQTTAESGAAKIDTRRELGEWVDRKGCVNTQSGLWATPDSQHRTGRSRAVTIARATPLSHPRNAVQSVTERMYA